MTRSFLSRIGRRACAARRNEDGNATVEFVLVFPPLMLLFISAFEIGLANVQHVMLERGTDLGVRELRLLGGGGPLTEAERDQLYENLRTTICDAAFVIPNCRDVVQIQLEPVAMDSGDWALMDFDIDCIDRTSEIDPLIRFENGAQNELMLVRVCAVIDPIFPSMGLGAVMPKDDSGGYLLVTSSAFVNEPS